MPLQGTRLTKAVKLPPLLKLGTLPRLKVKEWISVEPVHCHQRLPHNALISRVRIISEDRVFTELQCKFETEKLAFFYDHEIDHLPGMLEASAHRQASLVLAHLIYGVPIDWIALLDWMQLKLFNYGELKTQTVIKARLLDTEKTTHRFEFLFDGMLVQDGYPVMEAKGKLVMFSPILANKVRHKKLPFDAIPELAQEHSWIQDH